MPNLVRDPSFCFAKKTWTLKPSAPQSIKRIYASLKNFTAEELPTLVINFERHGIRGPPSGSDIPTPSSFCSRDSFSDFLNGRTPQHSHPPSHLGPYVPEGHWIFHYLHPNQDEEASFDWNDVRERRGSSVFSREDTPMYPYNPSLMDTIPEVEADDYPTPRASSLAPLYAASRASTPLRQASPMTARALSRQPSVNVTHQQPTEVLTYDTPATTGPPVNDPPQARRYPTRERHPPKPRYDPVIPARRATKSAPRRSSPVKPSSAKSKEIA
ncbi:hypothetical protein EYR40_007566 [Pleurotus pulmonarius]|nr:hypothetical protein EYR38_008135 [Pleurotus pulmonarius]KAF4597116.1 hypothetical protein EYR40_007566 [Pleurotus pulmonarius]